MKTLGKLILATVVSAGAGLATFLLASKNSKDDVIDTEFEEIDPVEADIVEDGDVDES